MILIANNCKNLKFAAVFFVLAGFSSSVASLCHPFAINFVVSSFVVIFFFTHNSKTQSNNWFDHRIFYFLIGVIIALIPQFVLLFNDLDYTLKWFQWAVSSTGNASERIAHMKYEFPILFSYLPEKLTKAVVFFYQSLIYGYPKSHISDLIQHVYCLVYFISFCIIFYYIIKNKITAIIWLSLVFFTVTFISSLFYPVCAENYALYPASAIILPLSVFCTDTKIKSISKINCVMFSALLVTALFSGASYLLKCAELIKNNKESFNNIESFFQIQNEVGNSIPSSIISYVDISSWPTVLGEMRPVSSILDDDAEEIAEFRNVIFNPAWLSKFIEKGDSRKFSRDYAQRICRYNDLVKDLKLRSIILVENKERIYVKMVALSTTKPDQVKAIFIRGASVTEYNGLILDQYSSVNAMDYDLLLLIKSDNGYLNTNISESIFKNDKTSLNNLANEKHVDSIFNKESDNAYLILCLKVKQK
jgi:hypothetical protein